jgi:hypothetical protein
MHPDHFWMIPAFHRVIKRVHHVYTHRDIDDILEYLSQPELPRGAISQISRDTGIPRQMLRDLHSQRSEEGGENWFPSGQGNSHARALSNTNEAGIADFIRVNHIRSGIKRSGDCCMKSSASGDSRGPGTFFTPCDPLPRQSHFRHGRYNFARGVAAFKMPFRISVTASRRLIS